MKIIVDKIIDELNNRAGFDSWWHNIDNEIQDEIKSAIETIIDNSNKDHNQNKYKIYTRQNLADISRDKVDMIEKLIHIEDNIDDAIKIANDYIKYKFFRKDTKLRKDGEIYIATDFCSYGKTIIIEKIYT